MYSRNTRDNRGYSVPPGYDGSRFRRRRYNGGNHSDEDEIIIIPDSGFTSVDDLHSPEEHTGELSVGGIPTRRGIREEKRNSAFAEDLQTPAEESAEAHCNEEKRPKEKLTEILEKLGFSGGMTSDELLICAVIFLIASDTADDGRSVGDVLLILALLLGLR